LPEIVKFCENADLLIHEAQYTNEELDTHRGWGHSSYEQAIEVAERAGVRQLAITHHDPEHNDAFLAKIEKDCQSRFPDCVLAREKMEIEF
jgi:ribonuclease BN (tRNA processing enzyme)